MEMKRIELHGPTMMGHNASNDHQIQAKYFHYMFACCCCCCFIHESCSIIDKRVFYVWRLYNERTEVI